jgi:glucose-1-phosphate thymidylyltransferase
MLAGIREILVITTPDDLTAFQELLGDGSSFGIEISYRVQITPRGIAEAFIIGKDFIDESPVALILGDNLFYGAGLANLFAGANKQSGANIFVTTVSNPSDYGVVNFDSKGIAVSIQEKPKTPKSNWAITGLYFFDSKVVSLAESVVPSARGELEITDILNNYLAIDSLSVSFLSRGLAWLDTGTPESLYSATSFVRVIEERTGTKIGCPEEIAWRNGWISSEQITAHSAHYGNNNYGSYLRDLVAIKEP